MKILDACCGSRMFWFDRTNKNVTFMDNRELETELCDGRKLVVKPDVVADFRSMPFDTNTFHLVVLDPPHLVKVGDKSWLAKKYGKLDLLTWRDDIS
ncbi:TPA: SAM-dependent methyltransferase, partial [Listeria monocytogenes]|nr:SAM-dependent methyltransferase [Listeria monocytogenes]